MNQKNRIQIIRSSAILSVITGVSVIIGWCFHIPILITVFPGLFSMKFNAALCFVLTGISLYFSANNNDFKQARLIVKTVSGIACLIAFATLIQYLPGVNLHIDDFFVKDYTLVNNGRMAPFTALFFIFTNTAILLARQKNRFLHVLSQNLLHGCTFIGILAIMGYLFGIPGLYKLDLITSMALNTSILILILSVATSLLFPDLVFTGLFTGNRLGNQMAKRLFPRMLLFIFIVTCIRLYLHRHDLISVEFGGTLVAIIFLTVLLFQIKLTAAYLNKIDEQRADADAKLHQTNTNLEQLVAERTKSLSQTTQFLKIASEGAQIGIWERNYVNDTITGNEIYFSNLGLPTDTREINAREVVNMIDSSNTHYFTDEFETKRYNDEDFETELLMNTLHKGKRYFHFKGVKFFDTEGKLIKMVGAQWDITDKKIAEEKLSVSEKAFRSTFENAGIGMALVNMKGEWLKVNSSLCAIVGYSEEELLKRTFQEITHPDDLKKDLNLLDEVFDNKREHYQIEKRYIHKNGSLVYIILSVSASKDIHGNITHVISQIIDITPQKLAEQKLIISERAFRSSFEYSGIGMSLINIKGEWLKVNKALCQMIGYTEEELMKLTFKDITHPEDSEVDIVLFKDLKDGKLDYYQINKRYFHKNGEVVYILLSASAVRDINGEILHFITQIIDITQQKLAEEKLNDMFQLTENQNERLKNFANIVSHNLRTHSGNMQMLNELFFEEHPEYLEEEIPKMITLAANNLRETVDHLSEVAMLNRDDTEQLVPVDLSETIHKTINSISALSKNARVKIIDEVTENTGILGVPAYVDSIILNFLTNAIKYRSDERESYVKLSLSEKDDFIILQIEDNGQGIDLEKHGANLFGMYKTFHKHEDSLGVGLFITKNQVEGMGGRIEVESKINSGTTFKVFFKKAALKI